MSEIRVNNITNRDGSTGTTVAGIPVVYSNSHFVVPSGRTGQRYVDGGENIVRDGLVLHLDAKYSYPSSVGIGTTTSGATASPGSSVDGEPYTWYDMSGNENHGQLVNLVGYNASNGGSLVFDGVNDYIDVVGDYHLLSEMTISVWFKPTNTISGGANQVGRIWGKGGDFECRFDGGGTAVSGKLACDLGGTGSLTSVNDVWSNTVWYNLVIVLSTSSSEMYIQSELDSTGSRGSVAGQTANLQIGKSASGAGSPFPGSISNFKIYNRALTASEVLQNYNALKGRFGL